MANPSWFNLPADDHDHSHHISEAIQSVASKYPPDISLFTSDGNLISTSKILLCLSSPFLARLLSSTPTPACMPTCIILPDCSATSLSDLISLLGGGVGISRFGRSNLVYAASEVIDAANLLGIMLGTLVDEAVCFREGGLSIPEMQEQQINATNVEDNNVGVEPLQLVKFSEAALDSELASLQKFGENNWYKPTHQNESDALVIPSNGRSNEKFELASVMPPKDNVVLTHPLTQEGIEAQYRTDKPTKMIKVSIQHDSDKTTEAQYRNDEPTKITKVTIQHDSDKTTEAQYRTDEPTKMIKVTIQHDSDKTTEKFQHTDILDEQRDQNNVLENFDSEPSRSFGSSQPIGRNDTEPSHKINKNNYDEQIHQNKSDIISDCFSENFLSFDMLLKNKFVLGNDICDENQNQELARMKHHHSNETVTMNQHDKEETPINSELGNNVCDEEETEINQQDTDETTKNNKHGSNVCEESKIIKRYDGTSEIKGLESETKKKDIQDICKTSFFQCDICDKLFVSREVLRKHGLAHLINQETIVRVKYDSGTDDYVCKDVKINVPNNITTNHSAHETEKANLIKENAIKSKKVRSASKRSRSFNENVSECIKNTKRRKMSTSRKELLTRKIDPEDHSHYGSRKNPCKKCSNCIQKDCGKCIYCKDKPKFGGPNKRKQKCQRKLKCSQPVIVCQICEAIKTEKYKQNIPLERTIKPQTGGRRGMPCGYKHLF